MSQQVSREQQDLAFRSALSYYPTGVVAITGAAGKGEAGLLVGSFTSVSLDPHLVGFLVDRSSTSWPIVRECDQFAINVLAADQVDVGREFSKSGGDKFRNVGWRRGRFSSAPIIENCVLSIECTLREEYEMGDHSFVLADVHHYEVHREHEPLVFFRGRFGTFSEGVT